LARAYTNVGIQTLGNYINGPEVDPEIKVQAIKIMFDRGWGRPVSKTEHTGEDGGDIKITIRNIIEESKKLK
jgi:hypothetical protein